MDDYDTGYADGEHSGYADWIAAIEEVEPGFDGGPEDAACLVAKYKWMRDEAVMWEYRSGYSDDSNKRLFRNNIAALEALWEDHVK